MPARGPAACLPPPGRGGARSRGSVPPGGGEAGVEGASRMPPPSGEKNTHSHFLIAFFSPFGFHSIVCVFKFQPGSAILRRISCFWGCCRKGNPGGRVEKREIGEQKALPQDPSGRSQLALFSPALSPEGTSCPSAPTAVTFISGLQGQVPPRKVSGRWAPRLSPHWHLAWRPRPPGELRCHKQFI